MSIKKQFLKSKPVCKVTFRVNAEDANGHKKAYLAGSFNKWKPEAMKSLKDGSFKLVKDLDAGQEHTFRYRLGKKEWLNDNEADKLVQSEFMDAKNCLLSL